MCSPDYYRTDSVPGADEPCPIRFRWRSMTGSSTCERSRRRIAGSSDRDSECSRAAMTSESAARSSSPRRPTGSPQTSGRRCYGDVWSLTRSVQRFGSDSKQPALSRVIKSSPPAPPAGLPAPCAGLFCLAAAGSGILREQSTGDCGSKALETPLPPYTRDSPSTRPLARGPPMASDRGSASD